MCALELAKDYKGITANYWKINMIKYNAIPDLTTVRLGLYESRRARNLDVKNYLDEEEFQFAGFNNQADSYIKLKASVPGQREITPAVTTGSILTGDYVVVTPAVMETFETNPFVNALDV
jgi:hypothetical protein